MKKHPFAKLERKDWQVISILLIMLVLVVPADIYFIYNLEAYKDASPTIQASVRQLRIASIVITALVLFMASLATYFIVKATNRRAKAEEENKNKQLELEQNLSLIQDLYENAPIGFHSTDIYGNIIEMNQTALEWLGYKREEVVGKMKVKHISNIDPVILQALNEQLKTIGKLDNIEGELKCKDGSVKHCIYSSRSIFDENGKMKQARFAVMDYTEKKGILDELEKAIEIAERSSLLKEQFVANISHEIRTPLNAILSFSKLLNRTSLNERQKEFSENIHSSSEGLLRIVNDILDFSKIEAGVMRIESSPFNPSTLVYSLESMFSYRAAEKRIQLDVKIADDVPDTVMGDPTRLTQILVNLLGNAFKFTDQGGIILEVYAHQQEGDIINLHFDIKDTGIGIPSTKLNQIFKRFGQAASETNRKHGGAGLGLTITKQLVDLQKGTIRVESTEGKGTTFFVKIPYQLCTNDSVLDDHDINQLKDAFKNREINILVAEDNPVNRRIVELQLEHWGLAADYAENGRIAAEMVGKKTYDLVLMDIQMPEMDGYAATDIIRNHLKLQMPIIATSAHAISGEREKCISLGMNDYLSKPVEEEELFNLINSYTSKSIRGNEKIKRSLTFVNLGFDRKYVVALTRGKNELLSELASLTIAQSKVEIQEMKKALKQSDFKKIEEAAHSMRSTVLSMGFNQLMGQILGKLETEASKKSPDEAILNKLYVELKGLRKKAVRFLKQEFLE